MCWCTSAGSWSRTGWRKGVSQKKSRQSRQEKAEQTRLVLQDQGGVAFGSLVGFLNDLGKRNPPLRGQLVRKIELHWAETGIVLAVIGPEREDGPPISFLFASAGVGKQAVDRLAVELGIAKKDPPAVPTLPGGEAFQTSSAV
jgi:hypothetical protein